MRSVPRSVAAALFGAGLVLTLGAAPALADGPKPKPAPTSASPGTVTRDPSPTQRAQAMAAAAPGLADKPLMGWSSWSLQTLNRPEVNPDGLGSWLTEANLLKQVDALSSKLKPAGYEYINIDAGWSRGLKSWDSITYDGNARELADPVRFPHGMKYVADYIHGKGLKAGIYLAVGLNLSAYGSGTTPIADAPGCTTGDIVYSDLRTTNGWDSSYKIDFSKPCASKYIDSQAALIASWGFDFLKLDGVGPGSFKSGTNYDNREDVKAWRAALDKTGRPIRFLVSWSLDRDYAADWKANSNGWRIDTDVECYCTTLVTWNNSVKVRWDDAAAWQPWAGPGGWNDLDALDVGNGEMDGLTDAERKAYMTLWAVAAAPLYTGDDLTELDAYGLKLLTNREVIALDQQGIAGRPVTPSGTSQVWGLRNHDGSYTVALFNMGSFPATVDASWASFGFSGKADVRDLWAGKNLGVRDGGISATIPSHGAELFRVTPRSSNPGVTVYEAENATVANGAAVADCSLCAGGKKVGNLYNGGAVQFRDVTVPKAGTYQVNVRYVSGDPRSALISANGQNAQTTAFFSSGGWDRPATATVSLPLKAGKNTIEIDSSTPVYSPDIDRIEVAR
ncbi:alpha-galactosidase D [Actinoplanes solisilvae]|uniref:alpha-galactosidase D n=1 Tax=Actinoplanes solisilvae TaxID=2486853 RepID=UPI00196B24E5|nr:carbohydrate-binding protein [Actinoplanes solisilvae]